MVSATIIYMLKIFDLPISDISYSETIAQIKIWIKDARQHLIVTANPEILLHAKFNTDYFHILKNSSLLLPDGVGISLLSYLFNAPIVKGRVMGVDLVERILKEAALSDMKVFMLGDSVNVLNTIRDKYSAQISYAAGPQFTEWERMPLADGKSEEVITTINNSGAEVLLVAFGAPKQERWIDYYLKQMPGIKVAIGVGGSLDYLSNRYKRAPILMQRFGLEWLWRLILQPKRVIRIIKAVFIFPILALVDHFNNSN